MDEEEFESELIYSVLEQAIRDGDIPMAGRSLDEVLDDLGPHVESLIAPEVEHALRVDHLESLAVEAGKAVARGNHQLAVVLYATHAEHWLNGMFLTECDRRGLSDKDTKDLMQVSTYMKTGIVWTLLFGAELDPALALGIRRLAARRNAFVHYKFPIADERDFDDELAASSGADLVERLQAAEDDFVFDGRRAELREAYMSRRARERRRRT